MTMIPLKEARERLYQMLSFNYIHLQVNNKFIFFKNNFNYRKFQNQ